MTFDQRTMLEMMNLERRRSAKSKVLSTIALLVGGALVGASVALLLTPKSGAELRSDLKGLKGKSVDPIVARLNGQAPHQPGQLDEA
jgi:hypothetical protein